MALAIPTRRFSQIRFHPDWQTHAKHNPHFPNPYAVLPALHGQFIDAIPPSPVPGFAVIFGQPANHPRYANPILVRIDSNPPKQPFRQAHGQLGRGMVKFSQTAAAVLHFALPLKRVLQYALPPTTLAFKVVLHDRFDALDFAADFILTRDLVLDPADANHAHPGPLFAFSK